MNVTNRRGRPHDVLHEKLPKYAFVLFVLITRKISTIGKEYHVKQVRIRNGSQLLHGPFNFWGDGSSLLVDF